MDIDADTSFAGTLITSLVEIEGTHHLTFLSTGSGRSVGGERHDLAKGMGLSLLGQESG